MALMEDSAFWKRLTWRINAELRASRDNNIRFLWLDGFVPSTIALNLEQSEVLAEAYVSENDGKSFIHYRVRLHLNKPAAEACRDSQSCRFLPDSAATGWLVVNRAKKTIEVDFFHHQGVETRERSRAWPRHPSARDEGLPRSSRESARDRHRVSASLQAAFGR